MLGDRPTFAVIAGATVAERRLMSVQTVRGITGLTDSDIADDALGVQIDATLASCARYCKLARDGASPSTFAQESVRATWLDASFCDSGWVHKWLPAGRGKHLLLPWRTPITDITVTEGETELTQDTDYRLLGSGIVERIGGLWPSSGVVVDYTAGWVATPDDDSAAVDGESMPADLVVLIAEQIKMRVDARAIDANLRSEEVPGIWTGAYNVPGGDSINAYGMGRPLQMALDAYRAPPSFW